MSEEKTTAYWLREFAYAAEHDPQDWNSWFQSYSGSVWRVLDAQQLVLDAVRYPHMIRHTPRRITINGPGGTFSYPEPTRKKPRYGTEYWVPSSSTPSHAIYFQWRESRTDHIFFRRGKIHLDKESAREHAQAEILAAGFDL